MRLYTLLCFCAILGYSCTASKKNKLHNINPENFGVSRASSLARDGIGGYLIVPLTNEKYAIATNFALCEVLLDGSFDGQMCSDAINNFYESKHLLQLRDILDAVYFDVIDPELLRLYSLQEPRVLINQMYDDNCIPIYEGSLSHASIKAAALIMMGVELVQTQYNEYELSTAACEFYRKLN